MAISSMQKVEIFGHHSEREEVLKILQELGVMEVRDFGETYQDTRYVEFASEGSHEIGDVQERLNGVQFGIQFLIPFLPKQNFLEKLSSKRLMVTSEEYRRITEGFEYQGIVDACYYLDKRRNELLGRLERLIRKRDELLPWMRLNVPVEQISETKTTVVMTFFLWRRVYDKLVSILEEITERFHLERVYQGDSEDAVVLIYFKQEGERIESALQEVEHREVTWREYKGTVKKIVESVEKEISQVQIELKNITEEVRELASHRSKLLLIEDYLSNRLKRLETESHFAKTKTAFMAQGWVKTENFPRLQEQLESQFETIGVVRAESVEGESPPVLLKNKKLSEPFEVVTNLYGSPSYFELDPTPALTPFFILLLAMCLTDAGYGLTIAALSLFALKKFRLGPGTKKLLSIVLYSGIATIVVGIFTGGYFGIDFSGCGSSIQAFRNQFLLVDPLNEPLLFMAISFGIGFLHISFGIVLEFYESVKKGRIVDGILDQISWICLLWGFALYGISKFGLISEGIGDFGKLSAMLAALIIVAFGGRENKNPIARIGAGFYALYGITGYFGDVLSYSRIMAMGMATGVIAMVVNTFVGMIKGIPIVGIVLATLFFIFGHLFNILINMVSGFIHTMRLQFVEFFQKFFEGGGKPFKPFEESYQHVLFSTGEFGKKPVIHR